MKKTVFWILISVLLLGAFTPGILWWGFGLANRWQFAADFESCEKEFNIIKDYVIAEYYDGETERTFYVSRDADGNYRLYEEYAGEYLYWPEEVSAALKAVSEQGFTQTTFGSVSVDAKSIIFESEVDAYALVYSLAGKPDDHNGKLFVKRIGNSWYHVTVNPDA